MAGASLLSGFLGRRKGPQGDPMAQMYRDRLYGQATSLIENPYGLGDAKQHMRNIGRDVTTAGLENQSRQQDLRFAKSGLSQAGGTRSRMDYYAGQRMSEGLNQMYSNIEMADFQAKEEQIARGENIMLALSNQSPIYAQLSAQNYWNSLNAQSEFNASVGNSIGSWYQNYLTDQQTQDTTTPPDYGESYYDDYATSPAWDNPYGQSDSPVTDADPSTGGYD
jgi:hypothetical protein